MKPTNEPTRLLDPGSGSPSFVRSALEAGFDEKPSAERLLRIAARLPTTPPAAPAAPSGAPPTMLSGALIGAALGVAVVGAGWVHSALTALPNEQPRGVDVATTASHAPVEASAPAPAPAPSEAPSASISDPAPVPSASSAPAAANAVASSPAPEPSGASPVTGETEAALLRRAQDALGAEPARALALTDEHANRFGGGSLGQEREVIAISALLGLGRGAEARTRAARFLSQFPASAHKGRLLVLLPDLKSDAGVHKDPPARPPTP